MRKLHAALLAAGGLALAAGAAEATTSRFKTMEVALPGGAVAQIEYQGDVAPRVRVAPVDPRAIVYDPFAELDRISAMMQAQHEAMLRQVAELQRQAATVAAKGAPGGIVVTGNLPAGSSYSYTVVTSTGGNGCTQRVEWRSDGSGGQPKMTQTSSGDCSAVNRNPAPVQVSAPAKAETPTLNVAAPVVGQTHLPAKAT
jgi:hypothetical protein